MNSQPAEAVTSAFTYQKLVTWLWPIPGRTITVGKDGKNLVVLPNPRSVTRVLRMTENPMLDHFRFIVLDSGGMDAKTAAAFNTVTKKDFLTRLEREPVTESQTIFVPASLARRWKLNNGDELCGRQVKVIIDEVDIWDEDVLHQTTQPTSFLLTRLTRSLGFGLGQALIFLLPLSVFGVQAIWCGLTLLFSVSLLLALIWDILPVPPLVNGLVLGVSIGGICGVGLPALSLLSAQLAWLLGLSAFLICVWMSIVFQGVKAG